MMISPPPTFVKLKKRVKTDIFYRLYDKLTKAYTIKKLPTFKFATLTI